MFMSGRFGAGAPVFKFGSFSADLLQGTSDRDYLFGFWGDDTLVGGSGDDRLFGGLGFDTAVYEGGIADYVISPLWGSSYRAMTVASTGAVPDAGTDFLNSIEALYFSGDDYTLYLDGRNNVALAGDDTATVGENDDLTLSVDDLLANDRDFDGDVLSIVAVDGMSALGGALAMADGVISYDPGTVFDSLAAGEIATDSFSYTVDDGLGGLDTAEVIVTITGANDAPVLTIATAVAVDENTTLVAQAAAHDVDGDPVTFVLSGADAAQFIIDAQSGQISFATAPDFETPSDLNGDNAYDLTVIANDGVGGTTSTDVTVTVSDVLEIPPITARVNELHYDNAGADTGEFIEIRVSAGDDTSFAQVELYNGSNGTVYNSAMLSSMTMTSDGTYDYYVWMMPANGLQNGAPDGIALSNGELIEFISYEGNLTGVGGAADGVLSTDIGVAETSGTQEGFALQRADDGGWWNPFHNTAGAQNSLTIPVTDLRINEFHYDNAGTDTGEFIEIRVNAGADASGVSVDLVNGNNGGVYNTLDLSGAVVTSDGNYDYYVLNLPSNGLQNGAPDGIALGLDGALHEFLTYEGTIVGVGGLADGVMSTDIGTAETGSTPIGGAVQRSGDGGSWAATDGNTAGAENDLGTVAIPITDLRINEIHYDNASSDVGEFIEIRVNTGADVGGVTVEAVNGNGGTVYGTYDLSGAVLTSDGAYDYYVLNLPANGLQNGAPDGLALGLDGVLVEFLTYEGTMTGVGGLADGVMSTDIGVAESGSTLVGDSLQRAGGDTWQEEQANTMGAANAASAPTDLRINEVHYDNASSDVGEFIEIRVNTGADVSGVTIEAVNGNGGTVYGTYDLSGASVGSDGTFDYYVLDLPANGLQNGAPDGLALGLDGVLVEFLTYEGTMTGVGGLADGVLSTDIGVAEGGSTAIGDSLQRNDDGSWAAPAANTSGAANTGSTGGGGGDGGGGGGGGDPATPLLISQVQGNGAASQYEGQQVQVTAIVTQLGSNGFWIQEEDADADGDSATSEGIFVYTGSAPTVVIGDQAQVTGTVEEFFGNTQLGTATVTVLATGLALPTAETIYLSPSAAPNYEAVEGMLVNVVSGTGDPLTVITNFNLDRYGQIVISAGVQYQPTQLYDAQTEAAEIAAMNDANANARLILDDGVSTQNPDSFEFLPGGAGDNGNGYLDAGDNFGVDGSTLRLGAELDAPASGVLTYAFGDYQLIVGETLSIDEATNSGARPDTPSDVGGTLQVASINMLNYFTTLDQAGNGSGPNNLDPRGADDAIELARQTDKLIDMVLGTGAEVFALQEIENGGFGATSAISTLVDELNAATGTSNYAFANPTAAGSSGYIGTDAITTGIVYDASAVTLIHSDYLVFDEPSGDATIALVASLGLGNVSDLQRNRPSVAATFVDNVTGQEFTVVSSHFKSKGSSGLDSIVEAGQTALANGSITQAQFDLLMADPNIDNADGQGYWSGVRTDAAAELADWMENTYSGGGVDTYLLLGDLNAYAQEDPVQTLRDDAGLTDLIDTYIGQENAYSFVFDGMRGALDHGLADAEMAALVTGATEWHINADEPDLLNYDASFKNPDWYSEGPFGASDHDPLIVGLDLSDPLAIV
jgi:VCBS repeat-containing protein